MSIAVVTGAGTGIGRAVALKFVAEGWRVAVVGRRREALDETIELAGPAGDRRMAAFSCDVTAADAVAEMGNSVLAEFGAVDVLVNSAGINVPRRSLTSLSLEDWHKVVE